MILSEKEIELSEPQKKMIESGWGKKVLDDVVVKKITYDSEGLEIEGYLAHPLNIENTYPLIIWNRGGNFKDGRIDEFLARGIFGEIASWGYVVLASQYRDDDEFGGRDVNDVMNLFPVADGLNYCDAGNAGMEGWSRGGMMTYLILSRTERLKCAVIISGLADLLRSEERRSDLSKVYKKIFGTEPEEMMENLKERSAVNFPEKIDKNIHLLLIHGTADTQVSHEDSVEMCGLLKKEGVDCELKLFEDGDHYLKRNRKETAELRKMWFDRFLKNKN